MEAVDSSGGAVDNAGRKENEPRDRSTRARMTKRFPPGPRVRISLSWGMPRVCGQRTMRLRNYQAFDSPSTVARTRAAAMRLCTGNSYV